MSYVVSYRTSVGALTLPAHDASEAMQKARSLEKEGFGAIEIIDPDGRRQEARSFEARMSTGGASRTLH